MTEWTPLSAELFASVAPAQRLGIMLLDGDDRRPTHFRFPHRTFAELMLAWDAVTKLLQTDVGEWKGKVNAMDPVLPMLENALRYSSVHIQTMLTSHSGGTGPRLRKARARDFHSRGKGSGRKEPGRRALVT